MERTRALLRAHGRARRIWVGTAAVVTAFALLVSWLAPVASAATASGGLQVVKQLDAVQGAGFTAPNSFVTGALVRYRITMSCSSNTSGCGVVTLVDPLDSHLSYQSVIPPTTSLPIQAPTATGTNPVTIVVGTPTSPVPAGTTLEFVIVAKVVDRPAGGTIPNEISGTTTTGGAATSDIVTISVPEPTPSWTLSKNATPASVAPNSTITWGVFVRAAALNNTDITSMTVVDTYPAGAVVVDADGGTVDTTAHTITWSNQTLTVAQSQTLQQSYLPWRSVVLMFPDPPFTGTPAQTVTNTVDGTFTYANGTSDTKTAQATATIVAPTPAATAEKYGPSSVVAGLPITWTVSFTNTGNTTLQNATVTDIFPVSGVTGISVVRGNYTQPVYPATKGPITFETTTDGSTWTPWLTYTTAAAPYIFPALPAGAVGFRMTDPTVAPGEGMAVNVTATTFAGLAAGTTITNCESATAAGLTSALPDSCVTTTVVAPFTTITPLKEVRIADPALGSIKPGDVVTFGVGGMASDGAAITTMNFADLLPPQFEYVETLCFMRAGTGGGTRQSFVTAADDPTCTDGTPGPTPTTSTVSTPVAGTTLLSWNDLPVTANEGAAYWVVFTARAKPGTAVGQYTNQDAIGTDEVPVVCNPSTSTTTELVDYNGNGTLDTVCTATAPVIIGEAAIAEVTKWDLGNRPNVSGTTAAPDPACPDWNGYTRYPCVAQTDPDSDFSYRFRMTNQGNINLTDYVAYDILPAVGDTGTVQSLSGSPRGTMWSPVLTGPLTLVDSLTTATGNNFRVEYGYSSNPCRPELVNGLVSSTWQTSCDDVWYTDTQVTDWSRVKAFRVVAFENGASWAPGTEWVLEAPMHAPPSALASSMSSGNINLSVAWNSIGHKEFRQNADGTTQPLLAAEAEKVGIIVPLAPAVSVGDYVWYDTNGDGLQSPGELPAPNVTVNLYDANGQFTASTTTNANGYYSFIGLTPGAQYTLEFVRPTGYVWTTQDRNGTSNVPKLDGTDSDVDPASGRVTFTAPASGNNLPGGPTIGNNVTDNPSLDAGLVLPPKVMNLTLTKSLVTAGPFVPGQEVTYTLVPSNEGPDPAAAGWTVTDVLPSGLTIVSMSGPGYVCDISAAAPTCTGQAALAPGTTGPAITVVARIDDDFVGAARNVAYVSPAPGDISESNPLVIPTRDTDTATTKTDNDAQADLSVEEVSDIELNLPSTSPGLAKTGSGTGLVDVAVALVLLMGGAGLVLVARRRGPVGRP